VDDPNQRETRPLVPRERAGRRLALRQAHLVVTAGPDAGRRFLFTPPRLSVGTVDDNDVVLTDLTVSKHHLVIEEGEQGCVVRDLGTTNGTFLGDHRIKEAFLTSGAILKLGQTAMRFEPAGQTVRVQGSARSAFGRFRGQSRAARELIGLLERVAPSELSVLVLAETGAGKEVVAQSIHEESKRAGKPFVVFDCSAVARELVESALFGHRAGAFTGASETRKGAFQAAEGGTLFLDEVGELPLDLQPKLLRALEQRAVTPLGSDAPVTVNVRVLAATNRDLREMVRLGTFRRDLYYRLAGVEVLIPPLRERREDVPLLARHFLEEMGQDPGRLTDGALEALSSAAWSGNVRELKNVVDRAVALAPDRPIEHADLMMSPADAGSSGAAGTRTLEDVEAEAVRATLERTGWNKSEAARVLGISRNTLAEKIQRYKLQK
jgi:DNA-binding NtrC family response regulator